MNHQSWPMDSSSGRAQSAQTDRAGWNAYVDATIAFLQRDRAALVRARARLAAVPVPPDQAMPELVKGVLHIQLSNGDIMKLRWPPNIDVVDGLLACYDQPYAQAYRDQCRPPLPD